MTDKLIKGIDEETWRRFAGYCKMQGLKMGVELTNILQKYLEYKGV